MQYEFTHTPIEYRWLKAHNFRGLTPWSFIEPESSQNLRKEFQLETGRDIFPFARRQDNDDIAGFLIVNGVVISEVITVHLTWSGKLEKIGFPITNRFVDILEWVTKIVIPESREWISEDELSDII